MSNFDFLAEHSSALASLGATAEKIFPLDPTSCVFKLRVLAESIAKDVAARLNIRLLQPNQLELLRAIDNRLGLDAQIRQMFHLLRTRGNDVAHEADHGIGYREGLDSLKCAREVALWYHRTFGKNPNFRPGPFKLPDDPSQNLLELKKQIKELEATLASSQAAQSDHAAMAELLRKQAEQEHALAQKASQERAIYEELAQEASETIAQLQMELKTLQEATAIAQPSAQTVQGWSTRSSTAASLVDLDEDATRLLIDEQLREVGWEVDSQVLRHSKGTRPQPGKMLAIAEWPMAEGLRADYILFHGMTPIGVVEAKRKNINVAGKIAQAEAYSRAFLMAVDLEPAWKDNLPAKPWDDGQGASFLLPFVYSCNGRPHVKQHPTVSGIWHRDLRKTSNLSRALKGFHSPDDLKDRLKRDVGKAEQRLEQESRAYLTLRDYQLKAVAAVEEALAQGKQECLLAMATGTGKTRTTIGLIYRLLKAERFKRILFLVDRTTLGTQAQDAFDEMILEQGQTLRKAYTVAVLGSKSIEPETRIHVATVQSMVQRIFSSDDPPSVGTYDCVIVDEAHRGYTLDQEMTEGELEIRDQGQYLSTYRRVLEYFDAVRIGMTATPAKHTTEIFGKPIYTYTYPEAVADSWLIDHEPPIRYTTLLSEHGIQFDKGDTVQSINLQSGVLDTSELEDELHFDVGSFNKGVLNASFNQVICEQLAQEFDPQGKEKTLIFCASDDHANIVVNLLNQEFRSLYGDDYNEAAVKKITGSTPHVEDVIKRFKNEAYPNIGVTVDLLTTGIDVEEICNLVFMRRVRSRVLYEQMKGRATRLCPEIGKTVFRIYDPVDLYATLEKVDTMKPLVKNPNVTVEQLIGELNNDASYSAEGREPGRTHADDVLDQLNQKIMRVLCKAEFHAQKRPDIREKLDQLEQSWGVPAAQLHKRVHAIAKEHGTRAAVDFLKNNTQLLQQLEDVRTLIGSSYKPIISEHQDELISREQSWGVHTKPEDYLQSFSEFIQNKLNESVALSVVVNRPKDLTRDQLREVRLLLDSAGYGEAHLQSAWRTKSNQDIAAGIVAHIRQAALGEALRPFSERVDHAMQGIYAQRAWTPVQRQWLDRIATQLKFETVLDNSFINRAFAQKGGSRTVDKLLGGQLDSVVSALSEALWQKTA